MGSNTETPAGGQSPTTPFADVAFDLLKDARRRHALVYLLETDGPVQLTTLAEHVAAGVAGPSDPDVETTRTALHHVHLPRMAEARMIEYDREESTIAVTHRAKEYESFLSTAAQYDVTE